MPTTCGRSRSATSRTCRKSTGEACHPEPRRRRRIPCLEPSGSFAALRRLRMTRHSPQRGGHFAGEVIALLLDAFAEFVSHEPRDHVLAALLLAGGGEVLRHGLLVALDVRLLEEAGLAVELLLLAGDHLLDDVLRLAGLASLLARDLALVLEVLLRHVLAAEEARVGSGDVHGHFLGHVLAVRVVA